MLNADQIGFFRVIMWCDRYRPWAQCVREDDDGEITDVQKRPRKNVGSSLIPIESRQRLLKLRRP